MAVTAGIDHEKSTVTVTRRPETKLAGKNFVQELNKNGDVKRTIITGNAGDGTDAQTVSDAASMTLEIFQL